MLSVHYFFNKEKKIMAENFAPILPDDELALSEQALDLIEKIPVGNPLYIKEVPGLPGFEQVIFWVTRGRKNLPFSCEKGLLARYDLETGSRHVLHARYISDSCIIQVEHCFVAR
jgi:hypothetical protein